MPQIAQKYGKGKKEAKRMQNLCMQKKSELHVIGMLESPWTFCGWWWDVKEIQTSAFELGSPGYFCKNCV